MYTPSGQERGVNLFEIALRDYLASRPEITALISPSRIVPEGFYRDDYYPGSEGLYLIFSKLGDGNQDFVQLSRYVLYAIDPRRGFYKINELLDVVRNVINDSVAVREFFVFPPDRGLRLHHMQARGTTSSLSLPQWNAEGQGLYVFAHLSGFNVTD